MRRRLIITVAREIYDRLHRQAGRGNISGFIERLVRPHLLTDQDLETGYRAMVADAEREREATEWSEGLIGDGLTW